MSTAATWRVVRSVGVVVALASHASATPAIPPSFKSLRYEEDYEFLRAIPPDERGWNSLKFIGLTGDGDSYLSLGGEVRQRYEYYDNAQWGQGPQDDDGYLLQRYMLHLDAHVGPHFRAFAQIRTARESGRSGGPRSTDEDETDIAQIFAEFKVPIDRATPGFVRLGRQELSLGSGRLVSVREGPNLRRSFDGLRLCIPDDNARVDFLIMQAVDVHRGTFNDRGDPGHKLWGIYSVRPFRLPKGAKLDLYYLGRSRGGIRYDQGIGKETRHSLGARWSVASHGWDYNSEFVVQFGRFAEGDITAWTVATDTGYTFASAPMRPRLGLKADIASGDRDPSHPGLQTFNALFPNGSYFSESGLIGPANIFDLHPSASLKVSPTLTLSVDWNFFWRESRQDGVYGTTTTLVRSAGSSNARHIGDQVSTTLTWQPNRHWTVTACGAYFITGAFLRDTGPSAHVLFLSSWVSFRF